MSKLNGVTEYIIVAPDSSLPNIASVNGRREEAHDNARLIAAAPEMLKALEEVARWYNNQTERIHSAPWIYAVLDSIALAKKD